MTRAVLLVPSPEWRERLLDPAFPFARVPTAYRGADWVPVDGWRPGHPPTYVPGGMERPKGYWSDALVLGWDGRAVPEGCDRLGRALADTGGYFLFNRAYSFDDAVRVAGFARDAGVGSVVLL